MFFGIRTTFQKNITSAHPLFELFLFLDSGTNFRMTVPPPDIEILCCLNGGTDFPDPQEIEILCIILFYFIILYYLFGLRNKFQKNVSPTKT